MGGKSKQSQRTKNNVRPSSSGRSAELLNNAVHIDPLMASKPLPVLFPTLAAPLDAGLNPDLTLCLKKLNKKDPITKTKALQELTELVKKGNVEDTVAALPAWAHYYRSLTTDPDHKVREATQVAHGSIVWTCGRRIAPQLKQMVPPWLQAQYDEYAPAAAAARHSLTTTFPESKLPDVISFCMAEVIAHLLENLVGNGEAALNKKMLSPEEKELHYARLVTASLQGLEYFIQFLPAVHDDWLWAELTPLLQSGNFWKLSGHKSPQIKASWYAALGQIIARYKDTFGAEYGQKTGRLLLGGTPGAQLWGCLLVLMHNVKNWHTWLDKKDLLVKKIIDVLENGGWGDAKHLSSMLLPLLAYLPEHMLTKEFYESFFSAVFKGLEKKGVISSKSERQSWITSLSECLRYLTVQDKDYVVEIATSVHRTWLERILLNPYDAQTTNNLIKHSTTNMAALVKYWLKQSKESNGEKYDQLVRNFWQNVAATMVAQIDKLSTEESDITSLVEGHILFLQSMKTSFSIDAKKPKSIKFNDEEEAKTTVAEESTQQCDASMVDRYKHNLNDVVHKICAHYFEFASKKQVAHYVFTPLLTLVIEFDDKNLFLALARHFEVDSVHALYEKVFRDWLAGDTMRCKSVADIVFLSMKHMTENEQEATLNSFKQFPPSVVEWCISLSLSHPHCRAPAVRRWLRGELVETSLVAVCKRMINDDDGKSRSLLLMCLAHDENGEILISPSSVSRIEELVSSALSSTAASSDRLASAACALASELGASCGLARALLRLQLGVPRGDSRLSIETWGEVRSAWQQAGAGSTPFRDDAVLAIHEALDKDSENLDILNIEHIASLCPYLLPRFDDEQIPDDIQDALALTRRLFAFNQPGNGIQTYALRHDCVRSNLNCPFDDDNDYIKTVIEESSTAKVKELSRKEAVSYLSKVVFRAVYLKALATHKDEDDNAWCEELFKEKYFEEEFGRVLYDYAVVCSLNEGYAFWPHYSIISLAKSHLSATLDDVIAVMPAHTQTSTHTHVSELASTNGYYWSYAKTAFEGKMPKRDVVTTSEMENLNLEEITGNGFFHTLQADTKSSDKPTVLKAKYLLMLRSFYLAHAHDPAVVDDTLVREAAACRLESDPDVIINAYYRHQHTMLYECDIATAEWRQVISNAAIVDYLSAMVDTCGWEAPASRWDFATISLCSITNSVLKSVDHWGTPKVALLARSVFGLYRAVRDFVSSVKAECLQRQPSQHVAQLPSEWKDIFAPDLTNNLFNIVLRVLETSTPELTSPQAAFISSLHPLTCSLDWHSLPRAQQATWSITKLLRSAVSALSGRGHHAVKYLAHALLNSVAKPLVLADAEALAAWMEDSSNDEDDAPRVQLTLADVPPALAALQELADSALQAFRVGEDTCEIDPFTDSHSVLLGYLLLADAALAVCQLARADLTHHYLDLLREPKHAEVLITVCLRLLPPDVAAFVRDHGPAPPRHEPAFTTPTELHVDEPSTSLDIAKLSCRNLFHCLRWAGGAARGWWGAAPPRPARTLERLCRGYVSPVLIKEQLTAVTAGADDLEDAEVTVHLSTNEVICVYHVEERSLELAVTLAPAHPLAPPRVAAPLAPPHNTHWLAVYLAYQNGTVINSLRMWMDTVAKRVEASPQCYICYCRLHPATGRLPRVPCHQCKNRFHAHCLRKWFSSSNKSNCPLCRAAF